MERKFYILESLRETDDKTGEQLYKTFKATSDFVYLPFDSKVKLFEILEYIKLDTNASNKKPFVHFDCHGNENGIGVVNADKTEELILWNEISDAFRTIYKASGKRSVICMSSCKGFNAIKLVADKNTCPYEYVSGSFEKIGFTDSFEGYKLFYELAIAGHELVKAGIQVHNKFDKLKFVCLSSSQLFQIAEEGYLRIKTTPEEIAKEKAMTIQNASKVVKLTPELLAHIDYSYSDAGIAEYMQEWRKIFFS